MSNETNNKDVEDEGMPLGNKLIKIRELVMYMQKKKAGQNNKYVEVSEILVKIMPEMNRLGILLYTKIENGSTNADSRVEKDIKGNDKTKYNFYVTGDLTYVFYDIHSKETIDVPFYASAKNISDPAQALGSGITYSKRYFLCEFFNIP